MPIEVPHKRTDLHLARRVWHSTTVMVMFGLYWFLAKPQAITLAIVISTALVGLDLMRLFIPKINQTLILIFKPILRTHETANLTAASYLLIGVTAAIFIFAKPIVLLMLLMLAFADPIAAIIGTRFGKDRLLGGKTLQGTVAAFCVCTVLSFTYFFALNMFVDRLVLVCLLAGFAGAMSELIPIGKLDDNFTFPLLCSSALAGLFYIYGVPNVF